MPDVRIRQICLGLVVGAGAGLAWASALASDLIPTPEFADHAIPVSMPPVPESPAWEWINIAVLIAALCLASYFALVNRSRRGLFLLAVASLIWFGFVRDGCVCSIGATQNVVYALSDPAYAIPATVVLLFVLPLVFTLFFGRTFCAAVCPLGAIQEVLTVRSVRVPGWLDHALGLIPYLYLGTAVIFAVSGTAFVICRYDPFVAMFRLSGDVNMLVFGASLLFLGLFVGRPYCRYLCPYGAILGVLSSVAKWHVRIPPEDCIQCRLCEDSCPYGAIQEPAPPLAPEAKPAARRRLAGLLLLAPVLIAAGGGLGSLLAVPLSQLDPQVRLAERVRLEDTGQVSGTTDASEAFRATGQPVDELYRTAIDRRQRFRTLGGWLGAWAGLVIGVKLVTLSIRRRRTDYQPDRSRCVSCGRCYWYCPGEQVRLGLIRDVSEVVK
ncbi:MAG: 4Fe-4S binding protein [Candidatus Anammoximicrobium sp.]|nr:4Fe-4S binding protein [Candidatus Anammoximicrobium sp.]